jgi:hypothetical protein
LRRECAIARGAIGDSLRDVKHSAWAAFHVRNIVRHPFRFLTTVAATAGVGWVGWLWLNSRRQRPARATTVIAATAPQQFLRGLSAGVTTAVIGRFLAVPANTDVAEA